MSTVKAGIAANLDSDILGAALPLFSSGDIQCLEWSFDTLFKQANIPTWFVALLEAYSAEKQLIGHGVYFSLFKARWAIEQDRWLQHLQKVNNHFKFAHITEHFGFMTGENFHSGAPLSVPFTASTLAIGQDRLQRIAQTAQCPVGVENLAFAFTRDDVKVHGEFLAKLVEPVNGFIILDLHNLYCQAQNFDIDPIELLADYPLSLVREIHISGGSWEFATSNKDKKIRRDTHDDSVPAQVFELLEIALSKCPNVKFCILEQLGIGLRTEEQRLLFRNDYAKMHSIISIHNLNNKSKSLSDFLPPLDLTFSEKPLHSEELYEQQAYLSDLLEKCVDFDSLLSTIKKGKLADSPWQIEAWDIDMLATAYSIAQKWK